MEELSPLLRLTPLVRRRIYCFVGVASWDPLAPHKFDLHGRDTGVTEQPKASTFHGLLLSCRVIYTEAAALLYSANRFVLHYAHAHAHVAGPGLSEPPEPLAPLFALTAASLASLTSLTIVLNQASCHHHFGFAGYYSSCCLDRNDTGPGLVASWLCERHHAGAHRLPLLAPPSPVEPKGDGDDTDTDTNSDNDAQYAAAQLLLAVWHSAAARLSHITSGRLDLGLVCDIDPQHERALEVARSVITPLTLIPRLRDLYIRLCKTIDPRLQRVAQDAVSQVLRIPAAPYSRPPTRTTLTSLPRELRLRILEYTDLITPSREVTWSRQDRGYVIFYRDSEQSAPDRKYRQQFSPCLSSQLARTFIGCFCRRRHTAFSRTCTCWAPPGPALFLVCRSLCQDAQLTFFSGNHFIIHDYKADPSWEVPFLGRWETDHQGPAPRYDYPSERFAASQFLREVIPRHCLAYLHFLELVFPPYLPHSWPRAGQPAMQDWLATVDWLQDKINAPGLTIRLVGADVSCFSPDVYKTTITIADAEAITRSYEELWGSLKPLADNGLARFYAHFPCPWQFFGTSRNYLKRWKWLKAQRQVLKERAERLVMGDRYEELYANGREEPHESFWTWTHYAQA
ncbi:hypothetical protein C8A01DRAFT_40693 [Parachaetomium inaequale]|uniref:Uncharacterized protein n=1 Tax=Parachaetomium inaequale TaxID=2588326 RepID=A0AAN6P9N5_9PEZI|nr:hypothetical protein C8A01DRAFT_40693 [Parachaetomium inaequale]